MPRKSIEIPGRKFGEKASDPLGLVIEALAFSAHKHRDQRRKDSRASPYINHPIDLANVLCNEGGIRDEVVICAALLHDTIEDTETSPEELRHRFGDDICAVVLETTDDKRLTKRERKRLQIEHASGLSRQAKLVKLADKICNLRDIAHSPPERWDLERRQRYFDWARQVVDGLRGVDARLERAFDEAFLLRPQD